MLSPLIYNSYFSAEYFYRESIPAIFYKVIYDMCKRAKFFYKKKILIDNVTLWLIRQTDSNSSIIAYMLYHPNSVP